MPQDSMGARVRSRRLALGKSQERLARDAQVSLPTIQRTEADRQVPKVALLRRIADALDLPLADLFVEPKREPAA